MRIITDTSSDITNEEAKALGIDLVEIAISFEDGFAKQGKLIDFDTFYTRLQAAKELPKTSQPSPKEYVRIIEKAEKNNEETLILALSSGLSGTVNAIELAAQMVDKPELVHIFDSQQAIIPLRFLVQEAVKLRDQNQSATEIIEQLSQLSPRCTTIGIIDSLQYLKKGGRIPGSLANLGTTLRIKPIVSLKDGVVQNIKISRGLKPAKKQLFQLFEQFDIDWDYPMAIGYTGVFNQQEELIPFIEEAKERFNLKEIPVYPVGGVIGTHLGPNALILSCILKEEK